MTQGIRRQSRRWKSVNRKALGPVPAALASFGVSGTTDAAWLSTYGVTQVGGVVSAWTDVINGFVAVASYSGREPAYDATACGGQPALVFAAGQALRCTNSTLVNAYTADDADCGILVVYRETAVNASKILAGFAADSGTTYRIQMGVGATGFSFWRRGATNIKSFQAQDAFWRTSWGANDGTASEIRTNGALDNIGTIDVAAQALTSFGIGARTISTTPGEMVEAEIAAVIVCHDPANVDVRGLTEWLATTMGLAYDARQFAETTDLWVGSDSQNLTEVGLADSFRALWCKMACSGTSKGLLICGDVVTDADASDYALLTPWLDSWVTRSGTATATRPPVWVAAGNHENLEDAPSLARFQACYVNLATQNGGAYGTAVVTPGKLRVIWLANDLFSAGMLTWLEALLATITETWTIVGWHYRVHRADTGAVSHEMEEMLSVIELLEADMVANNRNYAVFNGHVHMREYAKECYRGVYAAEVRGIHYFSLNSWCAPDLTALGYTLDTAAVTEIVGVPRTYNIDAANFLDNSAAHPDAGNGEVARVRVDGSNNLVVETYQVNSSIVMADGIVRTDTIPPRA